MTIRAETPQIMGYVDALTARPGERVTVRVSVLDPSRRYRAGLVRLICGETGPKGPGLKEERVPSAIDGEHTGVEQYTDVGSYALVENLPPLGTLALEILAWPSLPGAGVQTIMALGPVRLALDASGAAALFVGDQILSTGRPLRRRCWHRLNAAYDPATGVAKVSSIPLPGLHADRAAEANGTLAPGMACDGTLLFAAERVAPGRTTRHFEGKLEAPSLVSGELSAHWDFSRGIGTRQIEDRSRHGLHGETVNAPKRAVTGSRWDGAIPPITRRSISIPMISTTPAGL